MRKNLIWKLLGLLISVSIAVALLLQIDLEGFVAMIRGVPAWSLSAAFIMYLLLNMFRALRFRALLDRHDLPMVILYPIVLYHNFLVRLLPFKTGEVSYIVLLRQYLNQPLREGVSSLVAARLFELLVILIAASGSLLVTGDVPASGDMSLQRGLLIPVLLVMMAAFIVVLYYAGAILRVGTSLAQRTTAGRGRFERWTEAIAARTTTLAQSFDRVRQPRIFLSTLLLSTLTYSMSVSFNVVLLRGIGIETPLSLLIGIISIVMVAEALPLATISGLGIIEGGWALGLVGFAGFDVGQAASIGFFLHGCQLLSAVITGLAGYVWLQNSRRVRQEVGFEI